VDVNIDSSICDEFNKYKVKRIMKKDFKCNNVNVKTPVKKKKKTRKKRQVY